MLPVKNHPLISQQRNMHSCKTPVKKVPTGLSRWYLFYLQSILLWFTETFNFKNVKKKIKKKEIIVFFLNSTLSTCTINEATENFHDVFYISSEFYLAIDCAYDTAIMFVTCA